MGTVYILGAGASKFAGFPLASEFLPALQQEFRLLHNEISLEVAARPFIEFMEKVRPFIPDKWLYEDAPDLEFAMALVDWADPRNHSACPSPLSAALQHVCHEVGLCLPIRHTDVETGCKTLIVHTLLQHCKYIASKIRNDTLPSSLRNVIHTWVQQVQPEDHILTFNWDVLQEIMFWQVGRWHWRDGYGFLMQNTTESQEISSIRILKMHGSINWTERATSIWLDDEFMNFFGLTPEEKRLPLGNTAYYGDQVITPSYLKDPVSSPKGRLLWDQASEALRQATQVVVIGYSLPDADFHARKMITSALLHNHELTPVRVVLRENPEAMTRWEALCTRAEQTLESLDGTFEDFITGNLG